MGRNESNSNEPYQSTMNQPPKYQPAVLYQPAENQSQIQNVSLCDCSGSYCKYCWLGVFWCTLPYAWYKITKALNMGNMVKAVLAVSILYVVCHILNAPIAYNTPRVPYIYCI